MSHPGEFPVLGDALAAASGTGTGSPLTGYSPGSPGRAKRCGPAWAQRAAFGTGLLGLVLPILIIALNV